MTRLPTLGSARLVLDAFRQEDAEALYAYASKPEVAQWMAWEAHRCLEDSRAALRYLMANSPEQFEWAVRWRETGQLIGGFTFLLNSENSAEIHFTIAPEYWSRGLATEAGEAVLEWAWRQFPGLTTISTAPAKPNVASHRVLENLGFRPGASHLAGFHKFSGGIEVVEYSLSRTR